MSYFIFIWKFKFQKFLCRKIYFYSEKYLEPSWTSMKELFEKKINVQKKPLTIFTKRIHHRFSAEFYTILSLLIPIQKLHQIMFCWFDYILFYSFTANLLLLILLTSANSWKPFSNGWKTLTIFAKSPIRCLKGSQYTNILR